MEMINTLVMLFTYGVTILFFSSVVVCSVGFYYVVRLYSSARACTKVYMILERFLQTHPCAMARKDQVCAGIREALGARIEADPLAPFVFSTPRPFMRWYYAVERSMVIFYTTFGEHYMILKRTVEAEEAEETEEAEES